MDQDTITWMVDGDSIHTRVDKMTICTSKGCTANQVMKYLNDDLVKKTELCVYQEDNLDHVAPVPPQ